VGSFDEKSRAKKSHAGANLIVIHLLSIFKI
jgi:hypothetical protein